MQKKLGNIWTHHSEGRPIVITTNIGWKSDGSNVMGAGLAYEAAEKFPDLPMQLGQYYAEKKVNSKVIYCPTENIFCFPTKPLNIVKPWASWQSDSDLNLIVKSMKELVDLVTKKNMIEQVGVTAFGCGNGNLSKKIVVPLMEKHLDDRFILIERE